MIKYSNSKDISVEKVREFYSKYATWQITDSYDDWEKIINQSSCIITCFDDDKLIGMCRSLSDSVRWATIVDVLVHPDYRSKSIGKSMINNLLDLDEMQVRTIYLATPDQEKFYEKLGFKAVNEHCSYMIKVNKTNESQYFLPISL